MPFFINGIEFDVANVFDAIERCYEKDVLEKAKELVSEHLNNKSDILEEITANTEYQFLAKLGVEVE